MNVLEDSGESNSVISERMADRLHLGRTPCRDFPSDITVVTGESFRPADQVNLFLEIGSIYSMETLLVAPDLPVPFLLGGDYLRTHRCLADYFNALFVSRTVPQTADSTVGLCLSLFPGDARSRGAAHSPLHRICRAPLEIERFTLPLSLKRLPCSQPRASRLSLVPNS